MDIKTKMNEVLNDEEINFSQDPEYKEFMEYYKKLKESGIAKKEKYTIPLVNTISAMPFRLKRA